MSAKSTAKNTVKDEVIDDGAEATTAASPGAETAANSAATSWYAVTDGDWDWDALDGENKGPFICLAASAEDAARQAIAQWSGDGDGFDVKVAKLQLAGWQAASKGEDGTLSYEEFLPADAERATPLTGEALPPSTDYAESLFAVGEALVKAIEDKREHPALKNWAPTQCPSEVVVDLLNSIDELQDAAPEVPQPLAYSDAVQSVLDERTRQIVDEGYSTWADDMYAEGVLAKAGASYLIMGSLPDDTRQLIADEGPGTRAVFMKRYWPWDRNVFKPKSRRRDLVRGVALGLAEIERLDRVSDAEERYGEE
jgi:hypothetical protein